MNPDSEQVSDKLRLPALLLCLFFGSIGAHAFYARRRKQGLAILACLWIPLIGSEIISFFWSSSSLFIFLREVMLLPVAYVILRLLADLILIVSGAYKDAEGLPIRKWTGPGATWR